MARTRAPGAQGRARRQGSHHYQNHAQGARRRHRAGSGADSVTALDHHRVSRFADRSDRGGRMTSAESISLHSLSQPDCRVKWARRFQAPDTTDWRVTWRVGIVGADAPVFLIGWTNAPDKDFLFRVYMAKADRPAAVPISVWGRAQG